MTWICSQCSEKFARYRTRCPGDGMRVIEDLSGQLIGGRYRVRELIGVGGMDSAVWKAWQIGAERAVAIKVLPPADDAAGKRFARGARIAANLSHPNCLVIHDYGKTEDGKLYLAMELLVGQVLQDVLPTEGMPVPDVVHIVDQVLQALEHAHAQRAVHRDLKPDNLFLVRKNDDASHVKILDFGIAKYIEEDPTGAGDEESKDDFEDLVTEQRQVCGTPQYMAPEQVVGARVDGRADLYALGCVMYRMLTGRLPFDGKTRYELYQKHLQEAPRPFSEVRPDLEFPARLELIVMKALAKRPDQRFQTAAEMRHALQTVTSETRSRRATRARVALKHTSPQQPSAAPWTLSQQTPVADDAAPLDPTILPATGMPGLDQTVPPIPAPTPVPAGRAPAQTMGDAMRATSSQGLLNDAVLRHPASRGTTQQRVPSALSGPAPVPRSTETEPSSVADRDEPPRRRWVTFAVMAGAFLLGVGGVALAMSLMQGQNEASEEAARGATPPVEAQATHERATQGGSKASDGKAEGADEAAPSGTPKQGTPAEAPAAVDTHAGSVIGKVLADAPLEGEAVAPATPTTIDVALESEPAGATVKEGGATLGTTPGRIALAPGKHSLVLERTGFKALPLELDVTTADAGAPAKKLVLIAEHALSNPQPHGKPNSDGAEPQGVGKTAQVPNPKDDKSGTNGADGPALKKNDTKTPDATVVPPGDNKGQPKKPIVKLLDDDSGETPAPKPKVKVLDDP